MVDKPTFRMSSAGKCPRALSAQLLGMEGEVVPEFVLKAAEEGNWHEERIKKQLWSQDRIFIDCEQKEVTLEYPSFSLVGHIDGVAIKNPQHATEKDLDAEGDGKWQLLEIKTMSQFEFDRWMKGGFKAFPNYAAQITCYMVATKLDECLYIVKNRSSGYEDRQVLTEKPSQMTEVIGHLTDVTNHILGNELVPREPDLNSIECRRCEYKKLCLPEPKELSAVDKQLLEIAVDYWRDGKIKEAEAKELIDRARRVFEQHTRATNILKWSFSKLAIQLVHYSESVTYPKSKLYQHFTEEQLKPASQVKEAYDQLRITDLEKNNE